MTSLKTMAGTERDAGLGRVQRPVGLQPDSARPDSAPRALMVFHLAGQAYGIRLSEVQEIVPLGLLSQPPGLPSMLAGFLNLGGTAIPVVRLDRLFDLPELTPGLYTPLIVLRNPDYRVALIVERV